MLPLKHSAILRAILVFLHARSLLAESFSTNLPGKDLINEHQHSPNPTVNKTLKNSSRKLLKNLSLSSSTSNKILDELSHHQSENKLFVSSKTGSSFIKNLMPKRIVKRENSAINQPENLREKKERLSISKLNRTMINNDPMHSNDSSIDVPSPSRGSYYKYITFFARILYAIVCIVGLCGNTLVIYVVLRFSKMQTVTNMYILNLALADEMFLFGLPFLIITITYNYWAFGWLMCKIYMIMTSINQFTSSLLLTVMSADRYIAVCHPISSPRYRTPCIAKIICLSVWTLSAYLMIPIFIFADVQDTGEKLSCNIYWPEIYDNLKGQRAFTIYSFTLGFFVPLILILLFYFLVICKLRTISTKHKSREKKKTQRKVTYLVLVVISCYILCWLPYWITQVYITFEPPMTPHNEFSFTFMLLAGCLSYANSACNPILYAFLSENFKKSFAKAFTCTSNVEVNAQLHGENSVFPQQHHLSKGKQSSSSRLETASTYLDSNQNKVKKKKNESSSNVNNNKVKTNNRNSKNRGQITNLTTRISGPRKNKRLSLDLSVHQANRHLSGDKPSTNRCINCYINDNLATESASNLKVIKLTSNTKVKPLSFELNDSDQIHNKSDYQEAISSARFKRRRKSEPKLSMIDIANDAGLARGRRRSTLVSQDDLGSTRDNEGLSSDVDEDDLAYESEDEDYEEDSSLNSYQAKERNCAAMPARLKAKFMSVSGSKFLGLNRKPASLARTNSLEVIRQCSTRNSRKVSLVSSESSQTKKSSRNKLFSLMTKLTNKQPDQQKTEVEQSIATSSTVERRPENRISRKRISQAEAIHHRFGNLRRIQISKNSSQFNSSQATKANCESCNVLKHDGAGADSCENCLNDLHKPMQGLDSVATKSISDYKKENDDNNNYDANNDNLFIEDKTNCINSCTNSRSCESIDSAQCSKCLEKRGVIQTQL